MNPGASALYFIVTLVFTFYVWVVMLRILLSYQREDYFNPLSQLVVKLTDPFLKIIRKVIPKKGRVDYSAVALLAIVEFVKVLLLGLIFGFALSPASFIVILLADTLRQAINLYFYLIIIAVIAGWLMQTRGHPIIGAINRLVDPVLSRARKVIPPIAGFDFSPILVIVVLKLAEILVVVPLLHLGGM